ncbi:MAG: hypothetical protein HYU66_24280 [Armatimonadetes bacterium]|nr:hypothetical protein [Armatimonadota bacterium]
MTWLDALVRRFTLPAVLVAVGTWLIAGASMPFGWFGIALGCFMAAAQLAHLATRWKLRRTAREHAELSHQVALLSLSGVLGEAEDPDEIERLLSELDRLDALQREGHELVEAHLDTARTAVADGDLERARSSLAMAGDELECQREQLGEGG